MATFAVQGAWATTTPHATVRPELAATNNGDGLSSTMRHTRDRALSLELTQAGRCRRTCGRYNHPWDTDSRSTGSNRRTRSMMGIHRCIRACTSSLSNSTGRSCRVCNHQRTLRRCSSSNSSLCSKSRFPGRSCRTAKSFRHSGRCRQREPMALACRLRWQQRWLRTRRQRRD